MRPFFGRKEYRIDPKGRILLSQEYYSKLNLTETSTIIITCSPYKSEKCLLVFSEEYWNREVKRISKMDEGPVRKYLELNYISKAEEIGLDTQNRIRIPKYMMDFANIDKDVVFAGAIDKLKIWAKETLETAENSLQVSDELIDAALNKANMFMPDEEEDR